MMSISLFILLRYDNPHLRLQSIETTLRTGIQVFVRCILIGNGPPSLPRKIDPQM